MSSVSVRREGNIIHAIYSGAMTMDLVKDGERQIEEAMAGVPDPCILYDTLAMEPPTMRLAVEMKAFDARIRGKVVRSATVVHDAATAFMAKVAFVLAREHKVFYDDLPAAYDWLDGTRG